MPDRAVYLTREGFKRLDGELEHLRTVKRPEVSERIRRSKDMTDVDRQRRVRRGQERAGLHRGADRRAGADAGERPDHRRRPALRVCRAGSRVKVKDDEGDTERVPDRGLDGGGPEAGADLKRVARGPGAARQEAGRVGHGGGARAAASP